MQYAFSDKLVGSLPRKLKTPICQSALPLYRYAPLELLCLASRQKFERAKDTTSNEDQVHSSTWDRSVCFGALELGVTNSLGKLSYFKRINELKIENFRGKSQQC